MVLRRRRRSEFKSLASQQSLITAASVEEGRAVPLSQPSRLGSESPMLHHPRGGSSGSRKPSFAQRLVGIAARAVGLSLKASPSAVLMHAAGVGGSAATSPAECAPLPSHNIAVGLLLSSPSAGMAIQQVGTCGHKLSNTCLPPCTIKYRWGPMHTNNQMHACLHACYYFLRFWVFWLFSMMQAFIQTLRFITFFFFFFITS